MKKVLEILGMIVLGIVGLVISLLDSEKVNDFKKKQQKSADSFEKDLHDRYVSGDISVMQFGESLNKIDRVKSRINKYNR